MKKSLFKDFKIVESIFEFHFQPVVDIHRLASDFESNLQPIFENKATETMVPQNTPPHIPRFVLSSKKNRVLEVGPFSAIYKSMPENLNSQEAITLYQEKTRKIFQYLHNKQNIIRLESFNTTNIIHYPLIDKDYPIENDIFGEFLRIAKPEGFKAISLTIVRRSGNYSFTNAIDAYEKRDIKIQGEIGKLPQIKRYAISSFPITERGLINRIIFKQDGGDQNSSPEKISERFEEILIMTIDKITKHADEFIFKGN